MKVVVDTNIIFSGLLHSDGTIGDIVFNSTGIFEFFSCAYMHHEIRKHWDKLRKISGLTDDRLEIAYRQLLSRIDFINEELIPRKIWLEAERIVAGIDVDDVDFVALTRHLGGGLWTGDKILYAGLKKGNFGRVYNTAELVDLRNRRFP